MSSIVPTTPGLMTGAPTRARIGIDEADDLDAQFLAPLEQLLRQRHGRGAGADEQQPLARADLPAHPFERQPPADDERDRPARPQSAKTPRPMTSAGNQK